MGGKNMKNAKVWILGMILGAFIIVPLASAAVVRDAKLTVAIDTDPVTMDPANHRASKTEAVLRNMFDGLVVRDPDMNIRPELAESWTVIDDKTMEFKLRKGVTFHNGEIFDAEDVKFTIERLVKDGQISGKTSPRKGLMGTVTSVTIVDPYTVRINMSQPWPILMAMLPAQQIVPKDYIEKNGSDYFAQHPVGTGPFKFVEWKKGEQVVLERYEKYYGGSPEIPPVQVAPLKTVVFKVIPEVGSRVAALMANEVQIISTIPPHMVKQLKADPRVDVLMCDGARSYFGEMNVTKKPFDDVRVRKAMNYAFNGELITQTVLENLATPLAGILLPKHFAVHKDLKPYGYQPEKAKQLLREAGYPNGFSFEMDCVDETKTASEAYAMLLEEIGVKAQVRIWDLSVLREKAKNGERSFCFLFWLSSSLVPDGIIIPKLKTKDVANFSQYSNKRVDQLFDLAGKTMDQEKRKNYFIESQQIIYDEAPLVFGYAPKNIEAKRKEVKNWRPSPDDKMNLHDVYIEK
jgi:peptide/nickel transport system substrate-binding protein